MRERHEWPGQPEDFAGAVARSDFRARPTPALFPGREAAGVAIPARS